MLAASGQRSPVAATDAAIWHAIAGRGRRRIQAVVVGAVDEGDVILVEAERAAHEPVKTEYVARQLDHARKLSVITHARSLSPAIIALFLNHLRPNHPLTLVNLAAHQFVVPDMHS